MEKENFMSAKILLTGGTGLLGMQLSEWLEKLHFEIIHLSRNPPKNARFKTYRWDVANKILDPRALDVDYIINLAGAGISDHRWTTSYKKELYNSRVESTRFLATQCKRHGRSYKGIIAISAIGYYGMDSGQQPVTEESMPGKDFFGHLVDDWEKETRQLGTLGCPLTVLRLGMVLSDRGGALEKLKTPVKWGLGSYLGTGRQWVSWIHMQDVCRLVTHALDHKLMGTYNAVSPNPVTNAELTNALAKQLNKAIRMPAVPSFVLRVALGEMARVLYGGSKVSSEKIEKSGFAFSFPTIEMALDDLLGNWS